jgi:hypothetical protein
MSADVVVELFRSAKYKVVVIKRPFAQESVCFISWGSFSDAETQ